MAFLLPLLAGLGGSIIGKAVGGAEHGLAEVKHKKQLVVLHKGEMVVPKKLVKKVRAEVPETKKLPKAPKAIKKSPKSPKAHKHHRKHLKV